MNKHIQKLSDFARSIFQFGEAVRANDPMIFTIAPKSLVYDFKYLHDKNGYNDFIGTTDEIIDEWLHPGTVYQPKSSC